MSADLEFNDWRAEWHAQGEVAAHSPADVRRVALRQQRRLRTAHILELLAGVVFLAIGAAVAWRVHSIETFLWAATVWLTTLIASAFSVWNWYTLWKHDLKSVAEFSHVYEERCLAKIRAARFGKAFVVVQALISGPWLTWDYHRGQLSAGRFGGSILLLILLSVGFWFLFSRFRRSTLRELHGLRVTRNAS
jgi:hypothetical protein